MKNRFPVVALCLSGALSFFAVVPSFAQGSDVDSQKADREALVNDFKKLQQSSDPLPTEASLDAGVIIGLLQAQPALTLQIKKLLIKDAQDQGRLLEEADLTDAVLFDLIRRDQTIRIIATNEIMTRHYLELKPTDEETFRARAEQRQIQNLETQDERRMRRINGETEDGGEPVTSPVQAHGNVAPKPAPSAPAAPPPDQNELPRVSPAELPQLLTASASGGLGSGSALRTASASTISPSLTPSITPEPTLPSEAAILAGGNQPASTTTRAPGSGGTLDVADQKAFRRMSNPYAHVPALIDLYQQAPSQSGKLQRFGSNIFQNGSGNLNDLPMDVPVGPDYVVGPGDGINIDIWGSVSQRLQRVVDRGGRVSLPEVGNVQVAGKTLAQLQQSLQADLRAEFRDVQADISLARLRTVRVYVVGDVVSPGAYDVSSLSTPLNALLVAGGPTSRGSLRLIRHYRGKQLIEDVDIYDLLLNGVTGDLKRLESGDTIMIPPTRAQVAVEGMVRRPAEYELSTEQTLDQILQLAGGVLPSGTVRHIQVERLQAHENRVMLSLDLPDTDSIDQITAALAKFKVQDGDKIRVSPILPYAQKSVFLDGHVYRPGKYAYRDGMKISDLLHSYADMLPEPSKRHAELIRLTAPDFRPTVIAFNLEGALKGDPESNLPLHPLDTIRIFGRYDFEDPPDITVSGEVRSPGVHRTNGDLRVRDAVYLAGGLTRDALLSDAQVFRKQDGKTEMVSVNLEAALRGDPGNNLLLQPKDRLIIHRDLAKADPPSVKIEGEVERPGRYPLGAGMTATELVRAAGGFRRSAYTDLADLSRYVVQDGAKIEGQHEQLEIAKAFTARDADIPLRDGDTLTIRPIAGFSDIGATVSVKGQVMHPSVYGIKEGERLSSVLKRAGGFAPDAYPQGIVLSRDSLRMMEEQNRIDLISRLQSESASQPKYKPGTSPTEAALVAQSASLQQQQLIDRLKSEPPVGRLVVHINGDINKWENGPQDVELRKGDVLLIPKRPTQVMVSGQVYNPTAVTYQPGKDAAWYLRQAGGASELANKKSIYVIRADGSIVGRETGTSGFWHPSVLGTVLRPGDTVVVPEKLLGGTPVFKTLLESAQIISSIAVTAKAVGVF